MSPFTKYICNTLLVILFLGLTLALELNPDGLGFWRLLGIVFVGQYLVFFVVPEPEEE